MASIVPHRGRWRAHVYVGGTRESQVFRTEAEALAWARRREAELGAVSATFGHAAERWLAQVLPGLANAADQRTVEAHVRTHLLPRLGHLKLADITRADLVRAVRAVGATGKLETAYRVGLRIRQILDSAVDHGEISSHPGAGLSRVLPARARQRMSAIKPADLPALLGAIESYSDPVTRSGLLLLAHTFVRTSELIGATWDEIVDAETWVIPAARMKAKLPHVVPLSQAVRGTLADLRELGDGARHILPSPFNPGCGLSSNTLLFALYRLGYRGRMTGHGFRAVASTVLNESGLWQRDAIERQLAHRETDAVRDAYLRADYLEERRRMMEWYSGYLEARAASTAS